MTDNNGTWGIKITQSTYMFVVLLVGAVALLVISTSLNHTEVVRPHPTAVPVDPFANITYKTYTSLDGTFQVDYPETWTPQENPTTQLVTDFVPAGGDMLTGMQLYFTALRAMPSLPPDTSPEALVTQVLGQTGTGVEVAPAEVSGLKGACGTATQQLRDNSTGKVELCVLSLDSEHLVVIGGVTHADQWARMEPVMQRLKSSLKIKVESVIARIGALLGGQQSPVTTATPAATTEATPAATVEPTQEATSAATEAATSEATAAATAEVTPTN